ncbi:MAG TPA: hypothetical protein VMG37_15825 [Solirubrobacteraceae bacterium]|nr:hypothetical protein [Solirubrobacteraceae bacterium]
MADSEDLSQVVDRAPAGEFVQGHERGGRLAAAAGGRGGCCGDPVGDRERPRPN